jgi:4-alpha-glucanotransferase
MLSERSSGILLHPTSLPGPDGIGDLGPEAYVWIQFLADSGISLWQVLPLGPTGYGDSPYQCFSAFAGNPYLISPALLLDQGWLEGSDLQDRPEFPLDHVDFGPVIEWKLKLLNRAFSHFQAKSTHDSTREYQLFCELNSDWLDDYSLFMTIKENHGGVSWTSWPEGLRKRDKKALDQFLKLHAREIDRQRFFQYCFFSQWKQLKDFANLKGISIIGDIPIFVSHDSADVWSKPDLFYLDENGNPTVVAGVPPDYFSPTGQLWGNPHYRWEDHKHTGYKWWIRRIKNCLDTVDVIRLDHFRGFAGYWEVPAHLPTAEIGVWKPGPGVSFFEAIRAELGSLPLIAEDLGKITPDVIELRDHFNLPGMKILQFSFGTDAKEPFLPHNYTRNCVVYTGTHDNDTTIGWYQSAPRKEVEYCHKYLGSEGNDIAWEMIRVIWQSVAQYALAPMQDFLRLDGESRMNFPGKPSGNWGWRMREEQMSPDLAEQILELNEVYGR